MTWKPSPEPTRYDRARLAQLKPIWTAIKDLGLPLIRFRKLNGILMARIIPADPLLSSAVQLHERLIKRAIGGKKRPSYARAGAYCTVIRSIRRLQGREADFDRYYQGLFATYRRYSALKDELRKAVEGSSCHRRR